MKQLKALTRKAFTKWLSQNHHLSNVGVKGDADNCPISVFLTKTVSKGEKGWEVHVDAIKKHQEDFWAPTNQYATPVWARKFIRKIDNEDVAFKNGPLVSASEALDILQTI